ncbi:MAG: FeoA family protein [Myxococcota bacterium]
MRSEAPKPPTRAAAIVGDAASRPLLRLSEVAQDQSVVIVSVDSDAAQGRRLLDLGFLPGTAVRMVRRAPLGDPIQFELRGCSLCLRKTEADSIRVLVE